MKFGVRECANIVFRAKQPIRIGTATFQTGQPVLYIDSATTSSMEQSTTTVYAQGGRGNARLLSWEGEKTVTFSFTDALLSPVGFAILSGAGLFKRGNDDQGSETGDLVHFHMTSGATLDVTGSGAGKIDLRNAISEFGASAKICISDAPVYIMAIEEDGSLTGDVYTGAVTLSGNGILEITSLELNNDTVTDSAAVMVDYYVDLPGKHVWEADINAETFGGNYYVEADTLFRDQHTGQDLPANLTFPNVKLQSNFTMTFSGSGDPSTFDFTMDAFPDYPYFDRTKKVFAVLQVVDSIKLGAETAAVQADNPVMYHDETIQDKESWLNDSNLTAEELGFNVVTFGTNAKDNEPNGSDSEHPYVVTLLNIGDAVNLKNRLVILDTNQKDISAEVKPTFKITGNTNTGGYISLDTDGFVVAKANTVANTPVTISASILADDGTEDGDATDTQQKVVYFAIKVEAAQG